jgi:hypothetical protein
MPWLRRNPAIDHQTGCRWWTLPLTPATYWGRWASRRGDPGKVGPWSLPVSFTIAWGGASGRKSVKPEQHSGDDQSLKLVA